MQIVSGSISTDDLTKLAADLFGDMVKGVVDLEKGLLALDAELHSELEAALLINGSIQKNLWGINLYPGNTGDDYIEYDSMINVRPASGNRSRSVEDPAIRGRIRALVKTRTGR